MAEIILAAIDQKGASGNELVIFFKTPLTYQWLTRLSSMLSSAFLTRHSIFKMADDESKMNTSLEKPQGRWSCRYALAVSLITSAIIRGVVVCTGIGKTIRSKSAANSGRVWDQKYRFLLCV